MKGFTCAMQDLPLKAHTEEHRRELIEKTRSTAKDVVWKWLRKKGYKL